MGSLRYFFLLLCCLAVISVSAQEDEPISFKNPSFEGIPMEGSINGQMPYGWTDCGFPLESIPDIHPKENSQFGVTAEPHHGNTYIGLVVRENETWEMVSQRLSGSIKAGKCYEFSISLARSMIYESMIRNDAKMVNFVIPAKLRIWGGNSICERAELIDESDVVINSRWLVNEFRFEPKRDYQYIVFEAFYETPSPFPYNGNILMDNASMIFPVPCEVETITFEPEPQPQETRPIPPSPPSVPTVPNTSIKEPEEKILKELDRDKIVQGTIIQIDQLNFVADSAVIPPSSFPVLNEIFEFLSENPDVKVEIGGHTNNTPTHHYCDSLSTCRAKAVADFLSEKGIPKDRIDYKGYGKRQPLVSNSTLAGRRKNQRVEIKILSLGG
ncbi:MAG: OmpA family protein [Bacteroidota bacterium]